MRASPARVVLNVATPNGWYPAGQIRLGESLDRLSKAAHSDSPPPERMFWHHEPEGCPPHSESPYAFKPYCFIAAREAGYEQAIWLDASCRVVRELPWETLDSEGYYFGKEGWTIGRWCNERAKQLLSVTDVELQMPLMEGKIIGLDFRHRKARDFLNLWKDAADSGAFNGSWKDHRHDITCGAVIAHRLNMKLTDNPVYFKGGTRHPDNYVCAGGM